MSISHHSVVGHPLNECTVSLSAARVTSWEEQEQQGGGFVPPPPEVKALIELVQGKAEGEPLLFEETLKVSCGAWAWVVWGRRMVRGWGERGERTTHGV